MAYLIAAGMALKTIQNLNQQGYTTQTQRELDSLLDYAVFTRSLQVAKLSIELGANIHADTNKGLLSSTCFAYPDDIDMVQFLLDNGALVMEINFNIFHWKVLFLADT